jgi:hypothetical protein
MKPPTGWSRPLQRRGESSPLGNLCPSASSRGRRPRSAADGPPGFIATPCPAFSPGCARVSLRHELPRVASPVSWPVAAGPAAVDPGRRPVGRGPGGVCGGRRHEPAARAPGAVRGQLEHPAVDHARRRFRACAGAEPRLRRLAPERRERALRRRGETVPAARSAGVRGGQRPRRRQIRRAGGGGLRRVPAPAGRRAARHAGGLSRDQTQPGPRRIPAGAARGQRTHPPARAARPTGRFSTWPRRCSTRVADPTRCTSRATACT